MNTPTKLIILALVLLACGIVHSEGNIVMENRYFKYEIDSNARNVAFIDKSTGHNWLTHGPAASVQLNKVTQPQCATSAVFKDDVITYTFGSTGVSACVHVEYFDDYITLTLVELSGPDIYRIEFANIVFKLSGTTADAFAACGLACNLHTKVEEIPGHTTGIHASAYPHIGWKDAKVAIAASPSKGYRDLLKKVVSFCGMEYSKIGGPWALDAEINRGSYIIDFGGAVGEKTVDEWIDLAHALGAKQIDFHAGKPLRFGDYAPNPELYPNGLDGLKAVIEKMRKSGISAGLHTYAQFVAKDSPWASPVPDPRLAKLRTFTLSDDISADATEIPLNDLPPDFSTLTGFFVINSLEVQIGDELITFSDFTKESPYKLTGCTRGAFGTKAAEHKQGSKVEQLKQMFFLFVPDAKTDLIEEIARQTAKVYNYCGFDMIYLDALDGSWCCGKDGDDTWHIGSRFVWELNKHLDKPAIMEMSTFHHHLWGVRSRTGAWDSPLKAYKTFKDRHVEANKAASHYFLPINLGWFSALPAYTGDGILPQRIFMEDIEYICARSLAYDASLSYLLGFDPDLHRDNEYSRRIYAKIRQYEELRLSRYFAPDILEKLEEPGSEFRLEGSDKDGWYLRPVDYSKHVIQTKDDWSRKWEVVNPYEDQPVKLRIEALQSLALEESPEKMVLGSPGEFKAIDHADGVTGSVSKEQSADYGPNPVIHLTAKSENENSKTSWFRAGKSIEPLVNTCNKGIGVRVWGDGSGALLCVRQTNPGHLAYGSADHLVRLDFTGERYFSLVEPDGDACAPYTWPLPHRYSYENWVSYPSIDGVQLFLHDLPKGREVNCWVSEVKALPMTESTTQNPSVTVNGKRITFLATMKAGHYIEQSPDGIYKLYDEKSAYVRDVKTLGKTPVLRAGKNTVSFNCKHVDGGDPRYRAVVESTGQPIGK